MLKRKRHGYTLETPDVVPLMALYLRRDWGHGGVFHILLDGNDSEAHAMYCYELALRNGDEHEIALALIMLTLSRSQRARVLRQANATASTAWAGGGC